jgi:dethiobiotin synthetase
LKSERLHQATSLLRGLFVAGTDTGVGKTTVSAGLLRIAWRRGTALVPFKPAETGCRDGHPADAASLRAAAHREDLPLDLICPYAFESPVAPAAAAPPGRPLTLPDIERAARAAAAAGDALLVEAAGGLLCPYAADFTAADIAAALSLPVLLVARNALGTINHTLLALAEIRRRRLGFAGTLLVDTTPTPTPDRATNAELIANLSQHRPLGPLPHLAPLTPDAVADALEQLRDANRIIAHVALRFGASGSCPY